MPSRWFSQRSRRVRSDLAFLAEVLELRSLLAAGSPDAPLLAGEPILAIDFARGPAAFTNAEPASTNLVPPFALNQTFQLSSRPTADKTIFLDFDGHTITGTRWNQSYGASVVITPYTLEGTTAFSDNELASIQRIWQRVAEAFSPFDVNVTTQQPALSDLMNTGNGDFRWGVRALVGESTINFGGAVGLAYVGSFNWNTDTPALTFSANYNEKGITDTITHEVGHTLGLNHDGKFLFSEYYTGHGSGATGWAPIMGVGDYRPVVQWSRGEYENASNTEDDLAIITSGVINGPSGDTVGGTNGFGYRPDDVTNDLRLSRPIAGTNVGNEFQVNQAGVIEQSTDADWFKFYLTAGSVFTLNAANAPLSAMLDIQMDLIGPDRATVLATSSPPDILTASIANFVAPADGTYYVRIDGVGAGANPSVGYSDYSSLGQYTLTGTLPEQPVVADLTGVSLNMSVSEAIPGQALDVFYRLGNLGSANVTGATVGFYLSRDGEITTSDRLLGTATFSQVARTSRSYETTLTLPDATDPIWLGTQEYTIGMILDPSNAVPETDKFNNSNLGIGLDSRPLPVRVTFETGLLGVDFGPLAGGGPNLWRGFEGTQDAVLTDLGNENGYPTPIDLAIDFSDDAGSVHAPTFAPNQLSQHAQSLAGLGGNLSDDGNLTLTFSDLGPGRAYEVYVFGGDTVSGTQRVTVAGYNSLTFTQTYAANQLLVNATPGNSGTPLRSQAVVVRSNGLGQIEIRVTHTGGVFGIAGVAIREVPLIGIDFGGPTDVSPTNWSSYRSTNDGTLTNLIDESGVPTPYDLVVDYSDDSALFADSLFPSASLPYDQPLSQANGSVLDDGHLTLTFQDLEPGAAFEVYLYGASTLDLNQQVSITGANSVSFDQIAAPHELVVNGEVGSNLRTLGSFAQVVTADALGRIVIEVTHASEFYGVAGAALRKLPPANTPPTLGGISNTTYTENGAPKLLASAATITDPDSLNYAGARLIVTLAAPLAADRLAVRHQGTGTNQVGISGMQVMYSGQVVGELSPATGDAPLVVTFNAKATRAIVQAVLRGITFQNLSDDPTAQGAAGTRTISYVLEEAVGGTSGLVSQTVTLIAVNDPPLLTAIPAVQGYTEHAPRMLLAPDAEVADFDSLDFAGGKLTVQYAAGGLSTDRLVLRHQGIGPGQLGVSGIVVSYENTPIGTITASGAGTTRLEVTFNAAANFENVRAVVRNVQYENTSNNPVNSGANRTRTIRYTLSDGDGGTSVPVLQTLNVTEVNEPPVLGGIPAVQAYHENSAAKVLATTATVADLDGADFASATLTVTYTAGGLGSDRLTIRHQGSGAGQVGVSGDTLSVGGVVVGTFTGGTGLQPLVITFNADAKLLRVQAVLRNISYQNISDNPTNFGANPSRTVNYVLTDGDGGTSVAVNQTLNITAVNDATVVGNFIDASTYTVGAGATILDTNATLADADSADFAGGNLVLMFSAGGVATNRLAIRNEGTGANQIGASGNNVTFAGAVIGTLNANAGVGLNALIVTFTSSATPAAVQALLRNLTYQSTVANPTGPKTLTLKVRDGDGGLTTVAKTLNIAPALQGSPKSSAAFTSYTDWSARL